MGDRISVEVSGATHATCVGCGVVSGAFWVGWGARRVDGSRTTEPELALYCPTCADQEFGYSRRV